MRTAVAHPHAWSRTVLGVRAAAVVLVALAIPRVVGGLGDIVVSSRLQGALTDRQYPVTARVLLAFDLLTWHDAWRWFVPNGPPMMLLLLGAYLWLRRPDRLVYRAGTHGERA